MRTNVLITAGIAIVLVAGCGNDNDARRDPPRGGPTTAELNLAQRDEFVRCARQHDELGTVVGYGDTRVSVPRAIAEMLEGGGQFVGLREGDGPDTDVLIHADSGLFDLIDEERGSTVGGAGGQNARGQWSHYTTLSVDRDAPEPPKRVSEAISSCLRRAAAVFHRLGNTPR